jgi:hypothetical protein
MSYPVQRVKADPKRNQWTQSFRQRPAVDSGAEPRSRSAEYSILTQNIQWLPRKVKEPDIYRMFPGDLGVFSRNFSARPAVAAGARGEVPE